MKQVSKSQRHSTRIELKKISLELPCDCCGEPTPVVLGNVCVGCIYSEV